MIRTGLLKVTTVDSFMDMTYVTNYQILEFKISENKNLVMFYADGVSPISIDHVNYDVDLTNTSDLDDIITTTGTNTYEWLLPMSNLNGGELPNNANLNDIMEPGVYYKGATTDTIANVPDEMGNSTWTLEVFHAGSSGQLTQRITRCYKTQAIVMHRSYYTNSWGEWQLISVNGQKVLWSGALYMKDTHTANLSEKITDQQNGIVLVFSSYLDGAVDNSSFSTKFIPKKFVELQPGRGISVSMQNSSFSKMAVKYLYINDNSIDGHSINDQTGTGASGITYTNNAFVLRYVLGV